MKNILLVSIFVLLSVFSSDLKAQACCPDSSYTTYSVFTVDPNSGCDLEIVFCHKIGATGTRHVSLCEIKINLQNCNPSLIVFDYDYWSFVEQEMLKKMDSLVAFSPCPLNGPQTNLVAEFTRPSCMEVVIDYINQTANLVPCGSGFGSCIAYYNVCVDDGVFIKTLVGGPYEIGEVSCPIEGIPNFNSEGCFPTCY